LRKWLLRGGQLVLTVGVTWVIVDRVGLEFGQLAGQPSAWLPEPLLLTTASALLLTAYFVSAGLWGSLVRDLGGPRIPVAVAIRLFMIANLGRYVPGKVWSIAGLAALAKGRGVPAATATGAAVLGQGIALVAASAIGMGALLAGPERYHRWGVVGATLIGGVVVLTSIPPVFRALAHGWFRLTRTSPENEPRPAHGLRWLVLYLANWSIYGLSFWVLARSMGLDGDVIPVGSAFAAAYVLGYVMVFAPAGLGPREGFLIAFLTPHFGAGPSGVLAVVARLWTTVIELVPAGVFWLRHLATRGRPGSIEPAQGSGG
jgi:glycosyltransferase 2 family protein